jgi:hypothetical protein
MKILKNEIIEQMVFKAILEWIDHRRIITSDTINQQKIENIFKPFRLYIR